METKDRIIKNWITSIIGAIMMCSAIYVLVVNVKLLTLTTIGLVGALAALGYVFLMAKDSLIEGLFLGAFKISTKKDTGDPPDPPTGG